MPTITKAPTPQEFANAWTRGFAAAVRSEAGIDGRLSKNEAANIEKAGGNLAMYGDNAVNYLERTGQKTVSVNKLIGKGHDYAEAVAARHAGDNQRLSLVEARNLPADIRGDFFALRGKADPTAPADVGTVDAPAGRLSGNDLYGAFEEAAKTADGRVLTYTSESDDEVIPVLAHRAGDQPINGETVMDAFEHLLLDGVFAYVDDYRAELTAEAFSPTEGRAWLTDKSTYDPSWMDDYYKAEAEGFAKVVAVADANLSDVTVVKVGPKDDDGSLAIDSGTYAYFIVGKTDAGEIAGVHFGAAET